MTGTRDHGGNLDAAMARWGGQRADWLDLSTGINPVPYPLPPIPAYAWNALPTVSEVSALEATARKAFGTEAACLALSGAQAAIQLMPRLDKPSQARVLGPTYNEHAGALTAQGWRVETVETVDALAGATLAVIVNPNNPDGRRHKRADLRALAKNVGRLVVDESFADPEPGESLAPDLTENTLVLRSFGKFYGLAGLRLGFALGATATIETLRTMAGPWCVSGPAVAAGCQALADTAWQTDTRARLTHDAARLDALARNVGWTLVGGTPLFRTYVTPDAAAAQERLAQHRVWSRVFPYSETWLRLGMPAPEGWDQIEHAFAAF